MTSFAELLTYYMARVGISDSEMARTLGVRRQTIFRWKEGLVERPRSREDILRCAAKLRLTREERDQLLLSAGFPPESRPAMSPQTTQDSTDQTVTSQDGILPATVGPAAPRRFPSIGREWRFSPRQSLYLVALGVLLLGGAALLWNGFSFHKEYPMATQGETLILVGPLESHAVSRDRQERPMPKASERIKAAVERELQAGRLERVRVALWPDEIDDEGKVTVAVQRSGARLVVGGSVATGNNVVDVLLGAPGDSSQSPTHAQIGRLKIGAASPADFQLLALLVLAQLYADGGDSGLASATLTRALSSLPGDDEAATLATAYAEQISGRVALPR